MKSLKYLLIFLALATLPAFAQGLPGSHQPQQPDCRMEANAENAPGISCKGIEWPPQPKNNQPPVGVFNAKAFAQHPGALVLASLPATAQTQPIEVRRFTNSSGLPCIEYDDGTVKCLGQSVVTAKSKGTIIVCVASDPDCRGRKPRHLPFRRVADKSFWLVTAGHVLASLYDGESMQWCLHHVAGCEEWNPIYGKHPSRLRLYGAMFAIEFFTQDWTTYWLKRDDDEHREYIRDNVPIRHCKRAGPNYECWDEPAKMPGGGRWWLWGNVWTGVHVAAGSYNIAKMRRAK